MTRLSDGSPDFLPMTEATVVGGVLLGGHVPRLDASDFRDRDLGTVWSAVTTLTTPSLPAVAALLLDRGELDAIGGEPRLVELTRGWTLIYAGRASMDAHAEIIREWADRRRRLAALSSEARHVMSGRKVIPINERPEYQNEMLP